MKLIVAYIRPDRLNAVKQELYAKEIYSLSVTNVLGAGRQKGFTETYRGVVMEVNLLKKVRIEIGVKDELVESAMEAITAGAKTGKEGDGVVFVLDIAKVMRVRTGDTDI